MNTTDYPSGSDTKNAPWNEKETEKYYRDVEVIFFLERTETVRVECNTETDELLEEAKEAIDNVGTYLAKSLNLEYVDYDFENRNDKFEK